MTLKLFVEHDCSNHIHGGCIGVSKSCFPGVKPQPPKCKCSVITGQRCSFFEMVIMPLENKPSPKNEPNLQAMRKKAGQAYRRKHSLNLQPTKERHCPDCMSLMEKGYRYCRRCSALKAKIRKMKYWKNKKPVRTRRLLEFYLP
jgi:hypothetical protein